jgi:phage N-6-adenine-methyltransferase
MTAVEILITLKTLGCQVCIHGNNLRVQDPYHALTDPLRGQIREYKPALLALLEQVEERAAIMEYDGGIPHVEAERLAWACVLHGQQASCKGQQAKVYHRHQTTEWETPQHFFDALNAEFGFTLDVAASPTNAKCPRYFTPKDDGLTQPWTGVCWMNPPYGRTIGAWMRKAYEASRQGTTVVCLLPARTDTLWWHTYAYHGEIRFVPGRLTFGGAAHPAPFPSVVVVFRPPVRQASIEVAGTAPAEEPQG